MAGSKDQYVYTESEILCELEPPSSCSNYRDKYHFSDKRYMIPCNAIMEKYWGTYNICIKPEQGVDDSHSYNILYFA